MTREVEPRQKDWKHCPVFGPQLKDWYIGRFLAQATRGRITSHGQESPAALRALKEGYAVATTFDKIGRLLIGPKEQNEEQPAKRTKRLAL